MKVEQRLNKIERFIDFSMESLKEHLFYDKAQSVGTIRTLDVVRSQEFGREFDTVVLDFGIPMARGECLWIDKVPHGMVKSHQIVEIFVKRSKIKVEPEHWLTSLRPFNNVLYGKPFGWGEQDLERIFASNPMDSEIFPIFYEKFLKGR